MTALINTKVGNAMFSNALCQKILNHYVTTVIKYL